MAPGRLYCSSVEGMWCTAALISPCTNMVGSGLMPTYRSPEALQLEMIIWIIASFVVSIFAPQQPGYSFTAVLIQDHP